MEVEMRLCSNYDLTRCACWKKRLSLPHKLLQHPLLFLWFFFSWSLLFILCLGFCHSDWRRITQMPKSFFLSQAITSPTSANPVISAYKVGKNHKHKDGQSLKNLSIQNVLELMSSKHFTICHSYMCKKTIEESLLVDWDERVYDADAVWVTQLFLVLPQLLSLLVYSNVLLQYGSDTLDKTSQDVRNLP